MGKIEEAQEILGALGLPPAQQNEMSALTFLALTNLGEKDSWKKAKPVRLRIHDILIFAKKTYGRDYAENTRETVRRQVIHQFEQARIVDRNPDNPSLPTNSPRTHYALTNEIIDLVHRYGSRSWKGVSYVEIQAGTGPRIWSLCLHRALFCSVGVVCGRSERRPDVEEAVLTQPGKGADLLG